jgi:hypothetical protein
MFLVRTLIIDLWFVKWATRFRPLRLRGFVPTVLQYVCHWAKKGFPTFAVRSGVVERKRCIYFFKKRSNDDAGDRRRFDRPLVLTRLRTR